MADQEKANQDHYANQMNPNNPAYQARCGDRANQGNPNSEAYKAAGDNSANQMNPNNPGYKGVAGQGGQPKPQEWVHSLC